MKAEVKIDPVLGSEVLTSVDVGKQFLGKRYGAMPVASSEALKLGLITQDTKEFVDKSSPGISHGYDGIGEADVAELTKHGFIDMYRYSAFDTVGTRLCGGFDFERDLQKGDRIAIRGTV